MVRETPIPAYKADDVARTRKELKLSQRGLATALGVSPRTVESWEAGKNAPSGAAQRLLYLFECDHTLVERLVARWDWVFIDRVWYRFDGNFLHTQSHTINEVCHCTKQARANQMSERACQSNIRWSSTLAHLILMSYFNIAKEFSRKSWQTWDWYGIIWADKKKAPRWQFQLYLRTSHVRP